MNKEEIKLIKKLTFALLGKILLKMPSISSFISNSKKLLLFTTITGTLITSLILLISFQIYQCLIIAEFSKFSAMNIIIIGIITISVIFYVITDKYLIKTKASENKLTKNAFNDDFELIVNSFIEGFTDEKKKENPQNNE